MPGDIFRTRPVGAARAVFGDVDREPRKLPGWLSPPKAASPGAERRPTSPPPPHTHAQKSPSRYPSAPPGQHGSANYDAKLDAASLVAEMRESWRAPAGDTTPLAEALEELGQHIVALDEQRRHVLSGLERELWPLVRAVVERVLEREIKTDHTLARRLIQEGLQALADASEVSVTLGPGFLESADALEASLATASTRVRVSTDRSLPPFACNVETPLGSVDESLEARLDNILVELIPEEKTP